MLMHYFILLSIRSLVTTQTWERFTSLSWNDDEEEIV
jgi:hypothetical protein